MKHLVLLGFGLFLPFQISAGPSTYPCKPNELRRFHVSALLGSASDSNGPSELRFQQECMAWEIVVQPKAEFASPRIARAEALAFLFSPTLKHYSRTETPSLNPIGGSVPSKVPNLLNLPSAPEHFSLKATDFPRPK